MVQLRKKHKLTKWSSYLCTRQNPPSLSTMLKCAGRFIFYTFLLLRFSYFQNDSYFFVNIENMGENDNALIIKEL